MGDRPCYQEYSQKKLSTKKLGQVTSPQFLFNYYLARKFSETQLKT